jgi:hypothetical protein
MLVKGGYVHSMKLLLEKASETPDPGDPRSTIAGTSSPGAKSSGSAVGKPLARLKLILRVWKSQV